MRCLATLALLVIASWVLAVLVFWGVVVLGVFIARQLTP